MYIIIIIITYRLQRHYIGYKYIIMTIPNEKNNFAPLY